MSGLDQLISKLSWSRMGLDGEDLSQYIPRGVSVQDTVHAASELERLSSENAELLEALKPFVAADVYDDPPDCQAISGGPCAPLITYGDLRHAFKVVSKAAKAEGTE